MVKMMHTFVLLAVSFCVCASAQEGESKLSTTKEAIVERIEKGDRKAILELGYLGDLSVVPYLRKLLQQPNKNFGGVSSNAQMALAKLGDKEQMQVILSELGSQNPHLQHQAVKKLAYVGGDDSIRALARALTETKWKVGKDHDPEARGPKGERPMDRVVYRPLALAAMKALAQIVSDPPVSASVQPTLDLIPVWSEWLKRHNYLTN